MYSISFVKEKWTKNSEKEKKENLEAFSVDNGWTSFIVVLLGDPHGLECGEGSKDGTSDPDRVFSLWRSNFFCQSLKITSDILRYIRYSALKCHLAAAFCFIINV